MTGTLLLEDLANVNLPVLLSNMLSGQTKPPADRPILLPVWLDQAQMMLGRWVDEHGIYVEPADPRINGLVREFDSDVATVEAGVAILKSWSGTQERLWEAFGPGSWLGSGEDHAILPPRKGSRCSVNPDRDDWGKSPAESSMVGDAARITEADACDLFVLPAALNLNVLSAARPIETARSHTGAASRAGG